MKLGMSSPEIDNSLDELVNYPNVNETTMVAFLLASSIQIKPSELLEAGRGLSPSEDIKGH